MGSEEEEGEIKNYERRKQLRLRKKELQRKVKELERQVKEISPDSARIDLNGLLEDGEINEEERKKLMNLKEGVKLKKKTKKKLKHSKLGTNTETTEAEKNGKLEVKAEDNGTSTTKK